MKRPLRIAPTAMREIEAARTWWLENRSSARDLFDEEVAHGFKLLELWPSAVGAAATNAKRAGLRRLLLEPISYQLYYLVEGSEVFILRFRHARRRPSRV
ncbi:MAG: hypothetical protein NVSMB1_19370 [Polyangiales bacterium]